MPEEKKEVSTEYPKILYKKGWEDLSDAVIVNSVEEEEAAAKAGYKHLSTFKATAKK